MPISISRLSQAEQKELWQFLNKRKVYPAAWRFLGTINATNFPTTDGSNGSYRTDSYTPGADVGIVAVSANFIITPNTTVDTFALAVSYASTYSLSSAQQVEGAEIYELKSNGGAINDFEVFFPLNWYVEAGKTIYMHWFAGATTVAAGTSTFQGKFIFHTLQTRMGR